MLQSKILSSHKDIIHGFGTKSESTPKLASRFTLCEQTHSDKITTVYDRKIKFINKADGLITAHKGISIAIQTADCIPILVFDPEKMVVAAVHAGWRGTQRSILAKTIKKMTKNGSKTKDIIIAIGPSIGACCYDIPPQRARLFNKKVIHLQNKKYYLDLKKANLIQAQDLKIRKKNIEILDYCTFCRGDLFHSFRRDNTTSHKMYSFISLKDR